MPIFSICVVLVIVEDSREILAVYGKNRTNDLNEEKLSRAKILCFKFSQLYLRSHLS